MTGAGRSEKSAPGGPEGSANEAGFFRGGRESGIGRDPHVIGDRAAGARLRQCAPDAVRSRPSATCSISLRDGSLQRDRRADNPEQMPAFDTLNPRPARNHADGDQAALGTTTSHNLGSHAIEVDHGMSTSKRRPLSHKPDSAE